MNRLVLTRIAPWPAARLLAALYLVIGIIIMPFMVLFTLFGQQDEDAATQGVAIVVALFLPFIYAVAGFVTGGLGGLLYNLLARLLGGIPLMLEPESTPAAANSGPAGT